MGLETRIQSDYVLGFAVSDDVSRDTGRTQSDLGAKTVQRSQSF